MSYMTALTQLGSRLPFILFVFFAFSLFKALFTMVLFCFGVMFTITTVGLIYIYMWTNKRKTGK